VSEQAVKKLTLSLFEALAIEPNINQLEVPAQITIDQLTKILWESIELTQSYIRRTIENNHWHKAGTTIVVAAVMGDDVAIANVGDTHPYDSPLRLTPTIVAKSQSCSRSRLNPMLSPVFRVMIGCLLLERWQSGRMRPT
jgi:hypothetical protein